MDLKWPIIISTIVVILLCVTGLVGAAPSTADVEAAEVDAQQVSTAYQCRTQIKTWINTLVTEFDDCETLWNDDSVTANTTSVQGIIKTRYGQGRAIILQNVKPIWLNNTP